MLCLLLPGTSPYPGIQKADQAVVKYKEKHLTTGRLLRSHSGCSIFPLCLLLSFSLFVSSVLHVACFFCCCCCCHLVVILVVVIVVVVVVIWLQKLKLGTCS